MTMPFAIAASRVVVTGIPILLGPSPEMSMTLRVAVEGGCIQKLGAEGERTGNRGAAKAPERARLDLVGECLGALGIVDDLPGNDGIVADGACPFEIGQRNPAGHARTHRIDEVGVAQRLDIAGALQGEFLFVHRVRDVDRQHQFDVHRNRVGRRGQWCCLGTGKAGKQANACRPKVRSGFGVTTSIETKT